jgi:hypothetical protein
MDIIYKITLGVVLVSFLLYIFYGILVTAKNGKGVDWPWWPWL